jgi:hypothetical protein
MYWSRVPSYVRTAVTFASFSGVGFAQYACVAAHDGPIPVRCALAFCTMRPNTRSGACMAMWKRSTAGLDASPAVMKDNSVPPDRRSRSRCWAGNCMSGLLSSIV